MKEIKVSIIVPVYNTKKEYLKECLNSLVEQTIKDDIEIIVIDDGSTNIECIKICGEYAEKYSNLRVIHQKNQGLGKTRNNGIKIAKGKWIMFVDSDDWVEKNMCEKLLEGDNEKTDIIISSCNECFKNKINKITMFDAKKIIWTNKNDKEKMQLPMITTYILGKKYNKAKYLETAWAKFYRREFLIENKLYDVSNIRFKEDNIFNLYCFEYAEKIVYKNYNFYNYRQCNNSLIHSSDFKFINLEIEYLEQELKFIEKMNKSEKFIEAHYIKTVQLIVNIIEKYMINKNIRYKVQRDKLEQITNTKIFKDGLKSVNFKYLSLYLKLIVILLKSKNYWLAIKIVQIANYIKRKEYKTTNEMYE